MAEQTTTNFTYCRIRQLIQEGRYDKAIAMLLRRVECHPLDRAARLLLLLANISKFGPDVFKRQIEQIRFINDLSGNERYVLQQILLVCFRHAAQEGQTNQKIVYRCLIRRLMLRQPLDVSTSDIREIEKECSNRSCAEDISHPLAVSDMKRVEAKSETAPVAPNRIRRWSQPAKIGAATTIIMVLLGFYVATGGVAPLAQQPPRLLALGDSWVHMETGADLNPPAVILAPTFTAEPARRLIDGQLGELNEAYARWSEANTFTSGTVSLKLSIKPSGRIAKVQEVVSRLTEHRFLDMVVAEVKQWKLPLGGTKTMEISVPLIFVPAQAGPARLATEGKFRKPAMARQARLTTRTSSTAVKRKPAAARTISESETKIARTATLKQEPRYAANSIEKVGLGTRVTVLRKEHDWIKVKVQTSGNVGYLRKEYLTAYNTFR